jgi:tyrosine-protein phosphatase SIW14
MRFKRQLKPYPTRAILLALALWISPAFGQDPSGVVNFHQVNDHVYRGAQPSLKGIEELAKLGVKTIIDLREPGGRADHEKQAVEALGMQYVHVPLNGYRAPTADQVAKLLGLLSDTSPGPVFVHCRRGADRTGTIIACYRMVHDHWDNKKALNEAISFGMSWTERGMQKYILGYQTSDKATISAASGQQ